MRKRMFASYGAVAAVTALAATVLTACEPDGMASVAEPVDLSAVLDWSPATGADTVRTPDAGSPSTPRARPAATPAPRT
ncbi:MAG TPA: hypothetical protein VFZ93_00910 [Albitalea sp.]